MEPGKSAFKLATTEYGNLFPLEEFFELEQNTHWVLSQPKGEGAGPSLVKSFREKGIY